MPSKVAYNYARTSAIKAVGHLYDAVAYLALTADQHRNGEPIETPNLRPLVVALDLVKAALEVGPLALQPTEEVKDDERPEGAQGAPGDHRPDADADVRPPTAGTAEVGSLSDAEAVWLPGLPLHGGLPQP